MVDVQTFINQKMYGLCANPGASIAGVSQTPTAEKIFKKLRPSEKKMRSLSCGFRVNRPFQQALFLGQSNFQRISAAGGDQEPQ
jgi:hypothetical protein